MLETLKQEVLQANLDLVKHHLVLFTWGNVSAYDEETKLVVIKPSGVSYEQMSASDMVVVDLDGHIIEGELKPSSDTPTHLALYKAFKGIKAVVHTHAKYSTIFAQSKKAIPAFGTTHADYFASDIPVTRTMTRNEINGEYELETGHVIIERFKELALDPLSCPSVLVSEHGPFSWGDSCANAVHNAAVLEYVAHMAFETSLLRDDQFSMNQDLLKKHFSRKHGKNAYYGQKQ
ncbi:MAG: L-ribulose-5-phosphate 4-epimerase [Candidatus Izemoplasmataceae bacterium]